VLAGAGVQLGVFPSATFAVSAGAELAMGALAIGLRANGWPGVSEHVVPGIDAHFAGLGGEFQGCACLPRPPLWIALCATARAAALHARSSGATQGAATAPWYTLGAAAALSWPRASRVAVRVEAALAASLDRPRFVIADLAEVQRVPLFAPSFTGLLVFTP
jgi:hypothetical protein